MNWSITNREKLLGDTVQLLQDLDSGNVPHVSASLPNLYLHFSDEEGTDIGNLGFANGLHALWNDVYMWPDGSTECDDTGQPTADLDIRDAVSVSLQTH